MENFIFCAVLSVLFCYVVIRKCFSDHHKPVLSINPKLAVHEGSNVELICTGGSNIPLSYEWLDNDVLFSKSSTNILKFNTVNRSNRGNYSCKTSNANGFMVSDVEELTISCK